MRFTFTTAKAEKFIKFSETNHVHDSKSPAAENEEDKSWMRWLEEPDESETFKLEPSKSIIPVHSKQGSRIVPESNQINPAVVNAELINQAVDAINYSFIFSKARAARKEGSLALIIPPYVGENAPKSDKFPSPKRSSQPDLRRSSSVASSKSSNVTIHRLWKKCENYLSLTKS